MKGIEIIQIEQINSNNSGSTYTIPDIKPEGYLLAFRNKGSVSGNHYHEGKSKGKNPEKLLLIQGSVSIYGKDVVSKEESNVDINAPVFIHIHPKIIHTLTALTDIIFVEFNSLEEHKNDTIYNK